MAGLAENKNLKSIDLAAEDAQPEQHTADQSTSIRYGEDAFQDVLPLCEVACIVTTPTGKVLRCRTKYVGLHSNNVLLLEMPTVTAKEMSLFMQRGYSIKACVISSKGEGARVYFKSKIEYVLNGGDTELLLISVPKSTQVVVGLRASARLEISLDGVLSPNKHKYPCQIRDISQHGCLIVVDRTKTSYRQGSVIELTIDANSDESEGKVLTAIVKNVSKTSHYHKYGVQFDDDSLAHAGSLIDGLQFCSLQQKFTL
ncbi:PilZ domain-containing protein [Vibrio hepatarius]|uniref:PilZ domain-containing protein n=1 Tax=Vibrio hepatarius TaxID=171383 RepID=UPI003736F1CC